MLTYQVIRWENGAAEKHVSALHMHHHWPEHQQYQHLMCQWLTVNRHEIFHSFFHSLTAMQCAAVSWAGAWTTPGAYVYIHRLLHRLGYRIGNHRQLPFGSIQWVTYMPTCNASQTCLLWHQESHWRAFAMHNKQWGYTCGARWPVWALQRFCVLVLLVQGNWAIKMPHRNLLVMERTYISLSLSLQG